MAWLRIDADLDLDPQIQAAGFWGCVAFEAVLRRIKLGSGRGRLSASRSTAEHLAATRNVPAQHRADFAAGLVACVTTGLVVRDDDGALIVPNWPKYQEDPTAAERKQRERDRPDVTVVTENTVTTVSHDLSQCHDDPTRPDPTRPDPTRPAEVIPENTKPPRGKRAATRQQPNGHTLIIDRYRSAFVAVYSAEPLLTGGDRSQIGRMLRDRPPDRCAACWPACVAETIAAFVADPDPWLMEHRHPLRSLPGRANLYLRAVDWHAPDCRASAPALALVES